MPISSLSCELYFQISLPNLQIFSRIARSKSKGDEGGEEESNLRCRNENFHVGHRGGFFGGRPARRHGPDPPEFGRFSSAKTIGGGLSLGVVSDLLRSLVSTERRHDAATPFLFLAFPRQARNNRGAGGRRGGRGRKEGA